MVKEIRWTPEAESTFQAVIAYLQSVWSEREIANFIQATQSTIAYIAEHPKMFRKTNRKNVHEALVTPHNLLIYKVYPTRIDLITFWDTRQNPRKKKY